MLKSTPDSVSKKKAATRLVPPEPLHSRGIPLPCRPSRTLQAAVAATGTLDTSQNGHAIQAKDVFILVDDLWIASFEISQLSSLPVNPCAVSVTFVTSKSNQDAAREVKRVVKPDSYGNTKFCHIVLVCAA